MSYIKQTFIDEIIDENGDIVQEGTVLKAEHLQHIEDGIVANDRSIRSIRGENLRTVLTPINTINGYYINNSGALVASTEHTIEVYDVTTLSKITVSGSNAQSETIPLCAFGNNVSGADLVSVIKNTTHPVFSYPVTNENNCAYLFITIGANHCLQVFKGDINDRTDKRIADIEAIIGTTDDSVQLTREGQLTGVWQMSGGKWGNTSGFYTDYYRVSVGEKLRIYCESTSTNFAAWSFWRDIPTKDKKPNEYFRGKVKSDGLWIDDAVSPYDGYISVTHTSKEKANVYSRGLHPKELIGLYIGDSISTFTNYDGYKAVIENYYDVKYARNISGKVAPANVSMCVIPPETEEDDLAKKSIWYRCSNRNMDAYEFDFINLFGGANDVELDGFEVGTINDTPYLDTTETRPETVTFAAALMGCVEMLQRDFPDKPIVLCTIMPMNRSTEEIRTAMAKLQCQIALKYGLACVPWYWDMNSPAFRRDSVHPNAIGTMRMAGLWYHTVGKYLEKKSTL